jgi:hypothetical protein
MTHYTIIKYYIEKNDLTSIKLFITQIITQNFYNFAELWHNSYLYACHKKKYNIIIFFNELVELFPKTTQVALQQTLSYGKYL